MSGERSYIGTAFGNYHVTTEIGSGDSVKSTKAHILFSLNALSLSNYSMLI